MGVFTTAAKTWGAEALKSSDLNAQVRDFINGFGAWSTYTSSWTGTSTNPAIGSGSIAAAYLQVGKLVLFRVQVTFGSTTTFGTGGMQLTLPVTPAATVQQVANVGVMDRTVGSTGGARHQIMGRINPSSTTMPLYYISSTTGTAQIANVTNTAPVTLTNSSAANTGDYITITGSYEAA